MRSFGAATPGKLSALKDPTDASLLQAPAVAPPAIVRGRLEEGAGDAPQERGPSPMAAAYQRFSSDMILISRLSARDAEVRAHEAAHIGAGGDLVTGGPSFSYQVGPDGVRYAIGGEVGIDSSPVRDDPAATIAKMRTVRAAALAPAKPSGADLRVAAQASQNEAVAAAELAMKRAAERYGKAGGPEPSGALVDIAA